MQEFLGFGLLRPLRRDQKADFAAAGGEQLIRSAVGQILGTIGSSEATPGELPWRTEFGSLLHRLRHQKNDSVLQELGRVYVVDALKRWDPRIVVTTVELSHETHDGKNVLAIQLHYNVMSTNTRSHSVIFLDLIQTVTL
jgi:uncharacterized protein